MGFEKITISQFEGIKDIASSYSRLGNQYICAQMDDIVKIPQDVPPIKLDGIIIILNLEGDINLEINTQPVTLRPNQLTLISHNSVLQRKDNTGKTQKALFIFLSSEFLQNINIDLSLINKAYHNSEKAPVLTLEQNSIKMIKGYFRMLQTNADTNSANPDNIFSRNIARTLTASLVYYMMQLATLHYDSINSLQIQSAGTRRSTYIREFITLVQQNYKNERTVSFYARKLCISPKYLSAIIKGTTGHSAAEWIDQYVIIEAKNLLRFSGMTVQQVAYTLNFNNQSAFGKYFKHLTGISPSAFQKR